VVIPADLSKAGLDKWAVRPFGSELTHVVHARAREALDARELGTQVCGEPIDQLRAPTVLLLAAQDLRADLPVAA
jgi:hypothetical protein